MTEDEQRYLSGQPKLSRSDKNKKMKKMNRTLNYLIALVSVLIVIVTIIILNNRDQTPTETAVENKVPTESEEVVEDQDEAIEELVEEPSDSDTEEIDSADGNVISQSADANVIEVWTNPGWEPYATKQTGTHTSVFQEGHIDYEEKLAAAFSVLPIAQETSYVRSARNNGDANSARIVVSNKDNTGNYRVIIEWVDGQGWKPISVDVLHNVEGVK